jgi:hypothetical protein
LLSQVDYYSQQVQPEVEQRQSRVVVFGDKNMRPIGAMGLQQCHVTWPVQLASGVARLRTVRVQLVTF